MELQGKIKVLKIIILQELQRKIKFRLWSSCNFGGGAKNNFQINILMSCKQILSNEIWKEYCSNEKLGILFSEELEKNCLKHNVGIYNHGGVASKIFMSKS